MLHVFQRELGGGHVSCSSPGGGGPAGSGPPARSSGARCKTFLPFNVSARAVLLLHPRIPFQQDCDGKDHEQKSLPFPPKGSIRGKKPLTSIPFGEGFLEHLLCRNAAPPSPLPGSSPLTDNSLVRHAPHGVALPPPGQHPRHPQRALRSINLTGKRGQANPQQGEAVLLLCLATSAAGRKLLPLCLLTADRSAVPVVFVPRKGFLLSFCTCSVPFPVNFVFLCTVPSLPGHHLLLNQHVRNGTPCQNVQSQQQLVFLPSLLLRESPSSSRQNSSHQAALKHRSKTVFKQQPSNAIQATAERFFRRQTRPSCQRLVLSFFGVGAPCSICKPRPLPRFYISLHGIFFWGGGMSVSGTLAPWSQVCLDFD